VPIKAEQLQFIVSPIENASGALLLTKWTLGGVRREDKSQTNSPRFTLSGEAPALS
jgi:hypothetical protein